MKYRFLTLLTVICSLLLVLSCQNLNEPGELRQPSEGNGYFTLKVGGVNTGRTILPVTTQNNFAKYSLIFSSDIFADIIVIRDNLNLADPVELPVAAWDLLVTAYMDNEMTKPAARAGLQGIAISSGGSVSEIIVLEAIIELGEGLFRWNINYPANVTEAYMIITSVDYPINTQTLYFVGGGGSTVAKSASKYFATGYYLVVFSLNNGGNETGLEEYLHIYQNMESNFTQDFTSDYFTVQSVTNGADSGPGSLRYAIEKSPAGSTIIIEKTVDTIYLTSRLEIDKNLTIDGNGTTITRNASWTDTSAGSQLLYINNPANAVKISRLHFKDGRATDFGAAIRNNAQIYGTLTLESCIFSGNRTSDSGAYGGAIFNQVGNMKVLGCTFYDNQAGPTYSGNGGAIHMNDSNGQLTLAGNLFYGNKASSAPVVRREAGTVISLGYNVSDGTLVTGTYTSSSEDKTLAGLGITEFLLDTDTFSTGNAELLIIPETALSDIPLLDFYGNERTWPGVPGAVNYQP